MNKPEFEIGQKVTFKPYAKACKCTVIGIQKGMWGNGKHMDRTEDARIFYRLTGEAVSCTSGKSIMDSKLFEAYDSEKEREA